MIKTHERKRNIITFAWVKNEIGFEQENFGVFQHLHGSSECTGLDMGFSLIKKIVDQLNGLVTAQSDTDKYTKFSIFISTFILIEH